MNKQINQFWKSWIKESSVKYTAGSLPGTWLNPWGLLTTRRWCVLIILFRDQFSLMASGRIDFNQRIARGFDPRLHSNNRDLLSAISLICHIEWDSNIQADSLERVSPSPLRPSGFLFDWFCFCFVPPWMVGFGPSSMQLPPLRGKCVLSKLVTLC